MSTTTNDEIYRRQQRMVACLLLAGSAAYSVGSIGFIWSSWDLDNWLLPFQLACGVWTVGCLFFLCAITLEAFSKNTICCHSQQQSPQTVKSMPVPEVCQFFCAITFLVGCALGLGPEDYVLDQLARINLLFLLGSLALVVDVAWRTARQKSIPILDAIVAAAFVYAGIVGGYGSTINHLRAGMPGWSIGSIVSGVYPAQQLLTTASRESIQEDCSLQVKTNFPAEDESLPKQ